MTEARPGVIVERPDLAIYDTRELPWTAFEGLPAGTVRKVLARFPDGPDAGEPEAFIVYIPPGFSVPDLPYRHYHSTVEELSYTLGGELPHWEYRSAAQQHGVYSKRRAGSAMHRLGGSVHGLEPGAVTQVGYTSLMVRTGTGNWIPEARFPEQTVRVDYEPGWVPAARLREQQVEYGSGVILDWPDLKIWDTDFMEWQPSAAMPGALWKPLARDAGGRVKMAVVTLPPGYVLRAHRHYHTYTQMGLTLSGQLPLCDWESAKSPGIVTVYKQGVWVVRRPGAIHGCAEGAEVGPDGWCGLFWTFGVTDGPEDTVDVD